MRQNEGTPVHDPTVPNVARMYDFMLGGKDNYAADREAAQQVLEQIPHSAQACKQNRDFLGRAVTYLAGQGITQFIDIGSGLPTQDNVHTIAKRANPDARVIYVDYDPVVVAHAGALLAKGSPGVAIIHADLRDPGPIIAGAATVLDLRQPVAVLLFAILHFLTDNDDQPYDVVKALTRHLAPCSALAISHITGDDTPDDRAAAAEKVYQQASAPAVPRTQEGILRFFDGLTLVPPGLTDINHWPTEALTPASPTVFYGGVARKPS